MTSSLFELTCDYVVLNISNVESLVGLPELLGQELFTRFRDLQVLMSPEEELLFIPKPSETSHLGTDHIIHGLRLFAEAYGPKLLRQLDLGNCLLTINEHCEHLLPMLANLVALDLSGTRLGCNHEVMQHLTAADMIHLKTLVLKDCALSDQSIRNLTIPCRLYKKGISHVEDLDLSYNPKLTALSLKFLICLKKLNVLILSGTSVAPTEAETLERKTGLTSNNMDDQFPFHFRVTTEGWAEPLVIHWISRSEIISPRTPKGHFYSSFHAPSTTVLECSSTLNYMPIIRLIRQTSSDSSASTKQSGVLAASLPKAVTKRGRCLSPDVVLLNGYLEAPVMKQKRIRGLFDFD